MYDFDLRTPDSAFSFLLNFLNMNESEYINEWCINSNNNVEKFCDCNMFRAKGIKLDDVRVWGFHIVGSLDECEELRKQGLKNLQKVLSEDTKLSRVLKSYGVFFDIKKRFLLYKGKEYNMDYDYYSNVDYSITKEKNLTMIAHRIYCDYGVNGFMKNDKPLSYGTRIHERPEFLKKLSTAFPELKKIESNWEECSKSYKVSFYATIDQIKPCNFDLKETKEELTDYKNDHIKRWMVNYAVLRATDDLFSDKFLYVKNEVDIPPEQITSCDIIE